MDISFRCENQKFNYRVCAMIISENKILAMHDERSPYFYLPGGRVAMGETAEQAVIREVQEELGVTPKISRALWLNQAFFTEDVDNLRYHELCIYFLMDCSVRNKRAAFSPIQTEKTAGGGLFGLYKRRTLFPQENACRDHVFNDSACQG